MSEQDLVVGDLVMLKSGGPVMTVNRIVEDIVECIWHTSEGELSAFQFTSGSLLKCIEPKRLNEHFLDTKRLFMFFQK
jgi:uncharacterized protein YodC (DUF2158 family)